MANALITYADAPATLLSAYVDDTDTTMVVADASGLTSTGVVVVSRDNAYEIISYASKDDRHLYGLVRGDFGSTALAHNQGEKIALTTWTPSIGETEKVSIDIDTHITVQSLADFPTPVANVITLADNTAYLIVGTIDISPNRIVCGIKNTIYGVDRQNDILISDTTGVMFTMDNSVVAKTTLIFDNLTIKATAGTLISASGGATPAQVTFITTTITATPNGGTLSNVAFSMRTSSLSGFTTNGFIFSGSNQALTFRDSSATNNVGTVFDCTSGTLGVVRISRNSITASSGNTFLNATGTTITTAANIALNIFSGTSTHLVGVNENTAGWVFTANQGITNTPVVNITGNAATVTTNANLTGVVTSTGNATAIANGVISNAMLANGAVANLSGTNTGDSATNTQYSGLATSKQDTLVSATNIKTINGSSVLGSGNLTISGGATITAASINTGSTPKFRHQITVTDATVTAASKIILGWGQMTELDENTPEMDNVSFRTIAGTGQFDVVIASERMIRGIFKTNYTVG